MFSSLPVSTRLTQVPRLSPSLFKPNSRATLNQHLLKSNPQLSTHMIRMFQQTFKSLLSRSTPSQSQHLQTLIQDQTINHYTIDHINSTSKSLHDTLNKHCHPHNHYPNFLSIFTEDIQSNDPARHLRTVAILCRSDVKSEYTLAQKGLISFCSNPINEKYVNSDLFKFSFQSTLNNLYALNDMTSSSFFDALSTSPIVRSSKVLQKTLETASQNWAENYVDNHAESLDKPDMRLTPEHGATIDSLLRHLPDQHIALKTNILSNIEHSLSTYLEHYIPLTSLLTDPKSEPKNVLEALFYQDATLSAQSIDQNIQHFLMPIFPDYKISKHIKQTLSIMNKPHVIQKLESILCIIKPIKSNFME